MRTKVLSVIAAATLAMSSFSALTLSAAAEDNLVFEGITFTPWTDKTQLPINSGSYYLTNNINTSSVKNLMGKNINLCLNGHSVTMTGSTMIYNVANGSVLSLYDNSSDEHHYTTNPNGPATIGSGDGVFYGGYLTSTGTNGCIQTMGGTFNMYGGNIVGFRKTGVSANGGTFNMYGGSILGCYASNTDGGGVYVDSNGAFNMTGGEIRDNKVSSYQKGGGVAFFTGSFTVSGDAVITGNKDMNNATQNVYVKEGKTVSIGEGGLSDNARIGLTAGSGASTVPLVSGASGNESAFFSDNTGKSFALNKDGQLVSGDFASATYTQVGTDFDPQFSGDKAASLWKLTVEPGSDAITSVTVKIKNDAGESRGADDKFETPAISGGPVVFAVAVNLAADDIAGMKAVINDLELDASAVGIK